jgi:hypothetical protein
MRAIWHGSCNIRITQAVSNRGGSRILVSAVPPPREFPSGQPVPPGPRKRPANLDGSRAFGFPGSESTRDLIVAPAEAGAHSEAAV